MTLDTAYFIKIWHDKAIESDDAEWVKTNLEDGYSVIKLKSKPEWFRCQDFILRACSSDASFLFVGDMVELLEITFWADPINELVSSYEVWSVGDKGIVSLSRVTSTDSEHITLDSIGFTREELRL